MQKNFDACVANLSTLGLVGVEGKSLKFEPVGLALDFKGYSPFFENDLSSFALFIVPASLWMLILYCALTFLSHDQSGVEKPSNNNWSKNMHCAPKNIEIWLKIELKPPYFPLAAKNNIDEIIKEKKLILIYTWSLNIFFLNVKHLSGKWTDLNPTEYLKPFFTTNVKLLSTSLYA